jgi:APA family basic amino acid/polyamine antiporter
MFLTVGPLGQSLGYWAPLAFLLGGLVTLPVGLCFAYLSGLETHSGGAGLYAKRAFGPAAGFTVAWVMWLSGLIGGASVAVGFASLLSAAYPSLVANSGLSLPVFSKLLSAGLIVGLALLNSRGCREGALSNNLLAGLKISFLVGFVLWCGWVVPGPAQPAASLTLTALPAVGVLSAGLLEVLYAYSGFEEISLPASEGLKPERDVPRALVIVIAVSTLLYAAVQWLVVAKGGAGQANPLAYLCGEHFFAFQLVTLTGLASALSVNTSIAFSAPRSLWTLSVNGHLPSWLSALSERGIPSRCLWINCALTLILALSGSLEQLLLLSVLAALVQHLAATASCWRLRHEIAETTGRSGAQVTVVSVLASLLCCGLLWACSWKDLLGMLVAVLLGWLIRQIAARGKR